MAEPSQRPEHDDALAAAGTCECFGCHLRGVTVGKPSDFPSRGYSHNAPPAGPKNSYERGVPVSVRGNGQFQMPYLRADGDIMYQKEFDSKSHQIADNRARIEASARPK